MGPFPFPVCAVLTLITVTKIQLQFSSVTTQLLASGGAVGDLPGVGGGFLEIVLIQNLVCYN